MYFVFNDNGNHGKGETLEVAFENLINEGDDFNMDVLVWYKAEKISVKLVATTPPKLAVKKSATKKKGK